MFLPIRLEVCSFPVPGHIFQGGYDLAPGPWLTVDELRRWVRGLASNNWSAPDALPIYLLWRGPDPIGDGRVICVAGEVIDHVAADELSAWAERLQRRASVLLQVVRTKSRECILDADEQTLRDAHLACQATLQVEAKADMAQLRGAPVEWTRQVKWESLTRHSCGERLSFTPGFRVVTSAFRVGDIVYCAPSDFKMQHGVAVITHVVVSYGYGGIDRVPTGQISVVMWDPATRAFILPVIKTDYGGDRSFMLLPACCGRGAACPQLALTRPEERQWPNGDPFNVHDIKSIPRAFLSLLQSVEKGCKLQEHLKTFGRLLEPLALLQPSEPSCSTKDVSIYPDAPDESCFPPGRACSLCYESIVRITAPKLTRQPGCSASQVAVSTSSNASVRPPPASLITKLPGWWTPVLEHWPESKPWDDEYRSATKAHLLAVIDANLALRCAQDSMQPSE